PANSFQPSAGDVFDLLDWGEASEASSLSGTFDKVLLAPLPSGLSWNTSRLYTSGELWVVGAPVPGDFDSDYDVDSDDLTTFKSCANRSALPYKPGCTLTPDGSGYVAADFDRDFDADAN